MFVLSFMYSLRCERDACAMLNDGGLFARYNKCDIATTRLRNPPEGFSNFPFRPTRYLRNSLNTKRKNLSEKAVAFWDLRLSSEILKRNFWENLNQNFFRKSGKRTKRIITTDVSYAIKICKAWMRRFFITALNEKIGRN